LKPEIELYKKLGVCLIPVVPHSKKPLVEWKEYQTRLPTPEELSEWFEYTGNNVGVLTGRISQNLTVLDLDNKELLNEPILSKLAGETLCVHTKRGYHIYLRSLEPCGNFHRPYGLDVRSEGAYVVGAGSIHPDGFQYVFANENREILELDAIKPLIGELDKKYNFHVDNVILHQVPKTIAEGERNDRLFRFAAILREAGLELEQAKMQVLTLNDSACQPPLDATEVVTLVESAYHRPYLKNAASEVISAAGPPGRKKLRLTGEQTFLVDEIAPHIPEPQAYGTDADLFSRILHFLERNVIFAESETYTVVAAWILLSWRIEDTHVAPYLYVTAPRGHGKTRLLETLEQLVRRPLMAGYATRAGMIRCLDGSNATLLLDEAEHYVNPHEHHNSDMAAVLNAGYKRGAPAIMTADVTEILENGTKCVRKKPVRFDVFSAKCIVSRKEIFDTLEDRSFQVIMPKANRKLPPIDKKEAETIRGQLAKYRAECLERKQPLQAEVPETGEARLEEILEPLYAATPGEYREVYVSIIKREQALRLERIQESREFSVLEALNEAATEAGPDADLILTENVKDAFNRHHPNSKHQATNRSIGRTLARLGFKNVRVDQAVANGRTLTRRGYKPDHVLLERLNVQYGLAEPKDPDLSSLSSLSSSTMRGILPRPVEREKTDTHTTDDDNDDDDEKSQGGGISLLEKPGLSPLSQRER